MPVTQTPPAGWFPDPHDATQYRYWDGTRWTDHRSPRTQAASDQLARAGQDLADGLNRGLSAVGGWLQQSTATAAHPTFASVAASCRDEPPRDPLSHPVDLVLRPTDLPGLVPLFAASTEVALTPTGGIIGESATKNGPVPAYGLGLRGRF